MSPLAPLKPCREYGCPERVSSGYCEAHKHKERKRKSNYEKYRGSASSRGYGAAWRKTRERVLARDPVCKGGWSIHCQGRNLSTQCDHIVRKQDGGDDSEANLQGLCRDCHLDKTACENAGLPVPQRVTFVIP